MSSPMEKFIRDNREQFDSEEPRPRVWAQLEKQLAPAEKKGKVLAMKFLRLGVAAAILVLAGIGVFYLAFDKKGGDPFVAVTPVNENAPVVAQDKLLEEINPTYEIGRASCRERV